MSQERQSVGRQRLDSWKEIAGFFGRDERTVSRWEKELGLPVHRLPGTKGRVYAYTDELAGWSAESPSVPSVDTPAVPLPAVADEHAAKDPARGIQKPISGLELTTGAARSRRAGWFIAVVVSVALVALVALYPNFFQSRQTGRKPLPRSNAGSASAASHPHDPEAEQLYLQGRYYWDKRTPDDLKRAVDYFTQALVRDPEYAEAYSGLADSYDLLPEYSMMPADEAFRRSLAAARRAVELDDHSSEAHASLAFVSFFGLWELQTGEREFQRAIELNPNNAVAHHWYANALLAVNRLADATREIDRAESLAPASSAILADKGNIICTAGRHDEAIRLLKQMEARDPSFRSVHLYLMRAYLRKGDYPNFLFELREDAVAMHDNARLMEANAAEVGLAKNGKQGMFEAMLKSQQQLYRAHQIPPTALAETSCMMGRYDEALKYLAAAYEQHDGGILFIASGTEYQGLRGNPGYIEMLGRLDRHDNP